MKRLLSLLVATAVGITITAPDAEGRGGGRGGFGGGGGGAHMGGGGFGGGGGNFGGGGRSNFGGGEFGGGHQSFSGSRDFGGAGARPQFNSRPGGMERPSQGNFGGGGQFDRGAGGFGGRDNGPIQGREAFQSPGSFQRPTQNQLGNFLDLPGGGASNSRIGGAGGVQQSGGGGFDTKSYTTKGGTTITAGGKANSVTGPGGNTIGGAAGGVKIEGAGGNTYTKAGGAIGATDGTNSAIRGGSATGVQTAGGDRAVNVRGGSANSSGYRQGGSVTALQGKNGYTAVNAKGGYGMNGTGHVAGGTAIRGPGGNVVASGRGASFVNGQFVGGHTWSAVNGSYAHWNSFSPRWYAGYPGCWYPGRWAVGASAWAVATWASAGAYCGCAAEPMYYDYGNTVIYGDDGIVYNGDQPVATTEQYYDQANQLVATGANSSNEDWMSLGVFALLGEDNQTKTDKAIQLAVNKQGIIRGNLEDSLANTVTPVSGSVDKQTQRVAFKIQGNNDVVIETGLYNLTNDEVPVLVHLGPEVAKNHLMIRLQKPDDNPM